MHVSGIRVSYWLLSTNTSALHRGKRQHLCCILSPTRHSSIVLTMEVSAAYQSVMQECALPLDQYGILDIYFRTPSSEK